MSVDFNNTRISQPLRPNQDPQNQKRYAEVMAHEQAHKSAAGSFGGSIVIEKNTDGFVTGGHIPITIPGFDPKNPEKSKTDAQIVFKAALAPGTNLSHADYKVAAQAEGIIQKANKAIKNNNTGQKLDIQA